ncbi:YdcH family protein [Sinirhodobacter sp. WL0062]|uniref:YdcH family protein n=1 Tax=Rhodobacter flavimaris TaxID=2907145 RepID=A0ABS8YPR3_9RHOB|nr:YdcH family protein [Sinirhodobacter sp. WL0062]MCE5971892.1 YdcH family protein [Sinirhodobacter sp. WL0062]
MSNTPHTLQEEFPFDMEKLRELKGSNAHFARLLNEYDEINDRVHNAETNVTPMDSLAEVELRKKRTAIKDEIARMLAAV